LEQLRQAKEVAAMKPLPKWGMILITTVNLTLYLGLAAWGWGGWSALVAQPARTGAVVATVVLGIVAMFTSGNISNGRREDTQNRWIFVPFLVLGLVLGWLPAYTDRHNWGTIDGDAVRYLGLALYVVGCLLRVGAVFVLGRRFSGLVAIQEGHELETGGLYRVVRHPSYLGLLLGLFGWTLVFRSALGVLVALLLLPPLVARMNSEEALLESEFGERYAAYRRRTWRLVPFVY
jgi:protein-S-isoprenylcysteine O-methyltransferase Ste14